VSGGATEVEVKEKKDRVDDALNANACGRRGRHVAGRRRAIVARHQGLENLKVENPALSAKEGDLSVLQGCDRQGRQLFHH
jgi:chaperonin GroEL (HSP60 family)